MTGFMFPISRESRKLKKVCLLNNGQRRREANPGEYRGYGDGQHGIRTEATALDELAAGNLASLHCGRDTLPNAVDCKQITEIITGG